MKKMIITCLCMLVLTACGTKTETGTNTGIGTNTETGTNNVETTKEENSETIEIETDYDSMDFSKELNHIDTIKEETITEARIYAPSGKLYRTIDKEILANIVDKIAAIELTEIDPKTIIQDQLGFSELYLLNGNDVVYHFTDNGTLWIGNKCYSYASEEKAHEFEVKVIGYCRNTFYTIAEENSETIEIETDYDSMDFSKELNHINTIKEQTITEARIYHPSGQLFRTTDKKVLDKIVDKIDAIELTEIDPKTKEPVDGFSELYLLNGKHVVYHFTCDSALSIGDKCYGPEESALEFEMKVMNYCRETFYIMQEE